MAEPTRSQQIEAMLKDDPALLTAAVGGGLVIAYYLLAWLLVGRDPRRGTIIPLFAPPKGMSAAAVRFVNEMGFDDRVFTAAIVGLGVNGHLKLVDRGDGDQEVHHLKGTQPIDAAEQRGRNRRCSPGAPRCRSSNSEHELIGDARSRAASWRCNAPMSARCSATMSGGRCFGLVGGGGWRLRRSALSYADSYGSNTAGDLCRPVHPDRCRS